MGKIMYMGEAYTASPLPNAGSIEYDNSTSHLAATTMQGAVDEVADELDSLSDTSLETRASLITLPTGSSLNAYVQTYGRLVVINLFGYLTSAYTGNGELHFTNLPKLDGVSEIYAMSSKGRFRLYNDGNVASIRLYDTANTSSYIGAPFVYITT